MINGDKWAACDILYNPWSTAWYLDQSKKVGEIGEKGKGIYFT